MPDLGYDVFLSYNSEDKTFVRDIADWLDKNNVTYFLDTGVLQPGDKLADALGKGMNASRSAIICIGPNGEGHWQEAEMEALFQLSTQRSKFNLIGVLLPGADPSNAPWYVNIRVRCDLTKGIDKSEAELLQLKRAILGGPAPAQVAAAPVLTPCPDPQTSDRVDAPYLRHAEGTQKKNRRSILILVITTLVALALSLIFVPSRDTNDRQNNLTQGFIKTIGVPDNSSNEEREELWHLAALQTSDQPIRLNILKHWFQVEATLANALRHDARGLRAAVGINPALQKQASMEAKLFIDRLIVERGTKEVLDSKGLKEWAAPLAAWLEPKDAADLAEAVLTILENRPPAHISSILDLEEILNGLAQRMDPAQATGVAMRSAPKLLWALEEMNQKGSGLRVQSLGTIQSLGTALQRSIGRMYTASAEDTANRVVPRLIDRLQDWPQEYSGRDRFKETIKALMKKMKPEAAQKVVEGLTEVLEAAIPYESTINLRVADLVTFAPEIDKEVAASFVARAGLKVFKVLQIAGPGSPDTKWKLEDTQKKLAAWGTPEDAEPKLPDPGKKAPSAPPLLTIESSKDAARKAKLDLQALDGKSGVQPSIDAILDIRLVLDHAGSIEPQPLHTYLAGLSHCLIRLNETTNPPPAETKPRKGAITTACAALSPTDLTEVLKWPFAGGEAEKIILTALEQKTGKTFGGDVWKFVAFVEKGEIPGVDPAILTTPAKRPDPEEALRELTRLIDQK